jgi:predicted acylesterase/phospholipase RssA
MITRSCLLLLLLLSVVSCTVVHTWPYINKAADGAQSTHANYKVWDREPHDGMFVGLALSGGGSRSANFSSAVMLELKKRGILQHVDFISSVSGGSLPAAYYALKGHDGFEDIDVRERMGRNFQQRWLFSWFNPLNILRYWFTDFTRSDIMVPVFDSNLYGGATYRDLNRQGPKLLINATDSGSFQRFTFSDEAAAALQSDLPSFSLARAVNISSAFPGAFQTITLQDYRTPNTYVHLYDGGPADNLGLDTLYEVLLGAVCDGVHSSGENQQSVVQQSLSARGKCLHGRPPRKIAEVFKNGCLVISVDAATRGVNRDARRAHTRRATDYVIDSNVLNATDVMLLHNRESMLSVFGIRNGMIDVDRFGMFSFDGDDDQEKSYCYFWHIALRNIEPGNVPKPDAELGDRVHHIETSFNIEPTEQRDLFEAAAVLVKKGFEQAMGKGEGRGKEVKAILSKLAEGP